jgi:hypothetical protein
VYSYHPLAERRPRRPTPSPTRHRSP